MLNPRLFIKSEETEEEEVLMGPILTALVGLQSIERDLSRLRRRMLARQNAVKGQEARIRKHKEEHEALQDTVLQRRKQADEFELNLKQSEDLIAKLRVALNAAKTNKEYAAVLTQINTHKADNAKLEEQGLKILADVDAVRQQAEAVAQTIQQEEAKLEEIKASSAEEIDKLRGMIDELQGKREEAARSIPGETLSVFDRLALQYDGEAMAPVEAAGRRPPYTYTCGGCYMSLNAEHANALQTRERDEIRQCDNCRRILYIAEGTG
jgi:predicted  nucleic acid-binding Zn-ribbon protein